MIENFHSPQETQRQSFLHQVTLDMVQTAVQDPFIGKGRKVGISAPQFLIATIVDPTTFPGKDALQPSWDTDCREILKKFF